MRHVPVESSRHRSAAASTAIALVALAGAIAGEPASAQPSPGVPPEETRRALAEEFVLPDLGALEPAIAAAIERRYRGLSEPAADGGRLAERWARLAALLVRYGFAEPALAAAHVARELEPGEPDWVYLQAVLADQTGDLDDAARSYESLLADAEWGTLARLRLASAELERGRPQSTLELLPDAPAEGEEEHAAGRRIAARRLSLLGRAALALGDARGATLALERALELAPEANALHYPLGLAYRQLGDVDRARSALARRGDRSVELFDPLLARLDETVVSAHDLVQRALEARAAGDVALASDLYSRALAEDPSNLAALRGHAGTAAALGDTETALRSTERLLELEPDHSGTWFNLGVLHLRQERTDAAEEALRRALELTPEYGDARYNLALLLRDRGDAAGAREQLERLLASPNTAGRLRVEALETSLRLVLAAAAAGSPSQLAPAVADRAAVLAQELVDAVVVLAEENAGAPGSGLGEASDPAWRAALAAVGLLRQLGHDQLARQAADHLASVELPSAVRRQVETLRPSLRP